MTSKSTPHPVRIRMCYEPMLGLVQSETDRSEPRQSNQKSKKVRPYLVVSI